MVVKIKKQERVVAFPRMGKDYRKIIEYTLRDAGLKIIPDIPITDKTIKLGIKNSSDMFCFPYKVTLGSYMEYLEAGANTLLSYDTKGTCRFTLYNQLHDFTLKKLGYKDYEMFNVHLLNIVPLLSKLGEISLVESSKHILKSIKELKKISHAKSDMVDNKPNIALIGEIYCVSDEVVNYNLEDKLRKFGCNPINTINLGNFLEKNLWNILKINPFLIKDKYEKEALKIIPRRFGGHARENISELLRYIDKGIDGIVHIAPLSCMPESTIEYYINHYCSENKTPLLRLYIDENNSSANLETRVETYCEMIKMRLNKNG